MSSHYKDTMEIRKNYEKLVYAYNTMKAEANEKIRALETELKYSNGNVENTRYQIKKIKKSLSIETNNRSQREKELKFVRCELNKTKKKMKANENLVEKSLKNYNGCGENCTDYSTNTCTSCDTNKVQLEKLNVKIYELTEELKERTIALHECEKKNQFYLNELNEERIKSEEKDRDLKHFAFQLEHCYSELSNAWSQLQIANERKSSLEEELKCNNDLSGKLHEAELELTNVRHCLNSKKDEIECINRELCEKSQVIQEYIQIRQELDDKLIREGEQLKECETLKNITINNCNDLTIQNDELKNDLKYQKMENSALSKNIEKLNNSIMCASEKEHLYTIENGQLKNDLNNQKEENIILSKNIEELNDTIKCAKEKEDYWRQHLGEELEAKTKDIRNLNLEVKCVNEKLNNVEKLLRNTELKLMEESSHKEIIRQKICNMNDICGQFVKLDSHIKDTICISNNKMAPVVGDSSVVDCSCSPESNAMKNDCIAEKEKLKHQLNEKTQQLCDAKRKNIDREKKINSLYHEDQLNKAVSTQLSSALLSQKKVLKIHNRTLIKIINDKDEQINSMNDNMSKQLNYLNRRFEKKNKNYEKEHQMQENSEKLKNVVHLNQKGRNVMSNIPRATKTNERYALHMKSSPMNYDKNSKLVLPGLANNRTVDLKKCTSVMNNKNGHEPSDSCERQTKIEERPRKCDKLCSDRHNNDIVKDLARQLEFAIGNARKNDIY